MGSGKLNAYFVMRRRLNEKKKAQVKEEYLHGVHLSKLEAQSNSVHAGFLRQKLIYEIFFGGELSRHRYCSQYFSNFLRTSFSGL